MKNKIFILGILALISINANAGEAKYNNKIADEIIRNQFSKYL